MYVLRSLLLNAKEVASRFVFGIFFFSFLSSFVLALFDLSASAPETLVAQTCAEGRVRSPI